MSVEFLDANILIGAFRPDDPDHSALKTWLEESLGAGSAVTFPALVEVAFLRIVTHPQIFRSPSSLDEAVAFLRSIQESGLFREEPATAQCRGARGRRLSAATRSRARQALRISGDGFLRPATPVNPQQWNWRVGNARQSAATDLAAWQRSPSHGVGFGRLATDANPWRSSPAVGDRCQRERSFAKTWQALPDL